MEQSLHETSIEQMPNEIITEIAQHSTEGYSSFRLLNRTFKRCMDSITTRTYKFGHKTITITGLQAFVEGIAKFNELQEVGQNNIKDEIGPIRYAISWKNFFEIDCECPRLSSIIHMFLKMYTSETILNECEGDEQLPPCCIMTYTNDYPYAQQDIDRTYKALGLKFSDEGMANFLTEFFRDETEHSGDYNGITLNLTIEDYSCICYTNCIKLRDILRETDIVDRCELLYDYSHIKYMTTVI
jgi:hypothetical protein